VATPQLTNDTHDGSLGAVTAAEETRNDRPELASVRLLIAELAPTRVGIRMVLGDQAHVCAEAGDVEGAIRSAKREQPDVALIGTHLSAEWRAAVRGVCRAAPECAVVVLAQSSDADEMLEAIRAGAIGYVPAPLDAGRLRRVFRAVTDREAVVPRAMVVDLLTELRVGSQSGELLTGRETQILSLLRRGHTTAVIAERLHIAPVTVRRHISGLVQKFGVETRADLMTS
jgi:two-component system nitrate/nitrite response regulator NarL